MKNVQTNIQLNGFTTLKIGGPAKYLKEVTDEQEMITSIKEALKEGVKFIVIGEGSNLLISDSGYEGLVIVDKIQDVVFDGNNVTISSGYNLGDFINLAIDNDLMGMESLSGIPGTIGGAIYGNAGAYGQSISDCLVRLKVFDNRKVIWLDNSECNFQYRSSVFKTKPVVILTAEFKLSKGSKEELFEKSQQIIKTREQKYPIGIKCPGSFFKNVIATNLDSDQLSLIPIDKILHGKIPAGYLLEEVGAKGKRIGDVEVAPYHGNLFLNTGKATADDFLVLTNTYKNKVREKFGIELEPEVQLIGF